MHHDSALYKSTTDIDSDYFTSHTKRLICFLLLQTNDIISN